MMDLQLIINFRASLKPFKATDFFAFLFLPSFQRDVCNNPVAVQLNILSMKKYVENVLIIFMPVFVREKDIHGVDGMEAVKWQNVFNFLRAFH